MIGYRRAIPLTRPPTKVRIWAASDSKSLRKGRPMNRLTLIAALSVISPQPAPGGELPRAEPGAVGLSAEKAAELKPSLQRLVDEGKVPGGVALVVRHGKVAAVATFGYRDLASRVPMTEDTLFAVASMTKPVTCVAVMTLVE